MKEKDWDYVSSDTLNATLCCCLWCPADSDDIRNEYDILLNELKTFQLWKCSTNGGCLAITKVIYRRGADG